MFPGSRIPLHIFEKRYRKMIGEAYESGGLFGIVLVSGGKLCSVGSAAKVLEIHNRRTPGEFDMTAEGVGRFRMESFTTGLEGFYIGEVVPMPDTVSGKDEERLSEAVEKYNKLVAMAYKGRVEEIDPNDTKWRESGRYMSYAMAEKSGLDLEQRQALLETESEMQRIEYLNRHFDKLLPELEKAENISRIIQSDGYIQY